MLLEAFGSATLLEAFGSATLLLSRGLRCLVLLNDRRMSFAKRALSACAGLRPVIASLAFLGVTGTSG